MRIEVAISLRELRPFSSGLRPVQDSGWELTKVHHRPPRGRRSCNSRAHPQGTLRSPPLRIARGLLLDFRLRGSGVHTLSEERQGR